MPPRSNPPWPASITTVENGPDETEGCGERLRFVFASAFTVSAKSASKPAANNRTIKNPVSPQQPTQFGRQISRRLLKHKFNRNSLRLFQCRIRHLRQG